MVHFIKNNTVGLLSSSNQKIAVLLIDMIFHCGLYVLIGGVTHYNDQPTALTNHH
jgi:hypothetical protein